MLKNKLKVTEERKVRRLQPTTTTKMDENILSRGFILDALRPETMGVRVRPLNATVQVLGVRKLTSTIGNVVRHQLIISDGESTMTWVLLASALNSLVEEKLMEVFAVLRINEIACHAINNRKFLVLSSLEISIPGDFLRVQLGNPISCANETCLDPAPVLSEEHIDETSLTSGFIASVMWEEPLPPNPVVQILAIHRVMLTQAGERFRLFISDGKHSHTHAVLNPILNFLIKENRLQVFAVTKITKLSIMNRQNIKEVALKSLEVLREGRVVGRKLGNPVASHHATAVHSTAITGLQLTSGFIAKAMRSDSEFLPPNPLLQILGSETIGGNEYKLVISDGDHSHAFAVLAQPLSDSIHKKLHDLAIIQVKNMTCNLVNNKKLLTIFSLIIVTPGQCVGRRLGNPIPWTNIVPLNIDEIKLTRGYIADLIRGEKLHSTLNPLIQILDINKVHCPTQNRDIHQLVISDGKHSYTKATFGPEINDSFNPDNVDRFTVIRVKLMNQSAPTPFDTVTLILRAGEVVVDGKTVGRVLGKSKPWDHDHADGVLTTVFTGTDLDPECPSCLTYFKNPVYQCANGHLICHSCEPRCSKCPICRERMPTRKIRSVAFEKILTSLTKMM